MWTHQRSASILATGWYLTDPILSAGIGLLILWSSWRLLRESVEVLLESTPEGIEMADVRTALGAVDDVNGVHDLHVWTVTSGLIAMSGHVEVGDQRPWHDVLVDLSGVLRDRFGIAHATLQPEASDGDDAGFRGCSLDTEAGRNACRVAVKTAIPASGSQHGHRH